MMKKIEVKNDIVYVIIMVLVQNIISLMVWTDMLGKIIFGIASILLIWISLFKYEIIVYKEKYRQELIAGIWEYARSVEVVGFILLFVEEIRQLI